MEFGIGVRSKSRTTLAAVAAVGVAVTISAGCGGSDSEAIDKVDPRFAALPEDSQKLVAGVVTGEAHHVETGMALSLTADGSSVNTQNGAPFIITDVDADGDTHAVLDMTAAFGSMSPGGAPAGTPEMKVEQWTDGEWLYMEYTGFESFQAQAATTDIPFADLMEPGIFKVDLKKLESETELGGDATAILGESTGQDVDMTPFLYTLAANAEDATPDPDDPSKMVIETTLGELREQMSDESDSAPMVDDFTQLPGGLDGEEMMEAIDSVPMVFAYSTDDQDRIDDLTVDMDMSSFFGSLAKQSAGEGELPFGDMQMSLQMSMTIGYDDVEDVTMPADVSDDRTDAFVAAVKEAQAMADEATADTAETTETTEG